MDNLEAQTYETFEKDTVKYSQVCDDFGNVSRTIAALHVDWLDIYLLLIESSEPSHK